MTISFHDLGLDSNLINGLKKEGIDTPKEIQEKAIPFALRNKDIIGQSQTGSGKTLAYVLPIFQKIDSSKREMQAIILAPTHELVMQIDRQIKSLAENSALPLTSASIIGEVNVLRQIEKLKEKPHIIVGSPGRVLELIKKKKISSHTIKTIVIDEADKLLNENNLTVVKDIIKTTMRDRQLMVFSATINEKTLNISKDLMKDAKVIKIENQNLISPAIDHMYFTADQRDKIPVLRKLISAVKPEKGIIFINRHDEIEVTTSKLQYHHINAFGISGNATKEERKKTLDEFRKGKIQLLVASDIAARGLDIKDITHIFNLDLPKDSNEYLHRAGRTGRSGKPGTAISIVTEKEIPLIKKYERIFNVEIKEREVYKGTIINPRMRSRSKVKADSTSI